MALTKQQSDPHPRLVECRNAIEAALNDGSGSNFRKVAAGICEFMSDELVEAVLAADGDSKKIVQLLEPAKEVAQEVTEEAKEKSKSRSK